MPKPKHSYEGLYATKLGLNVCFRTETGGVPRFENLFIRFGEFRAEEIDDLARAVGLALRAQEGPPWEQDALPGIG